MTLDLQYSYTFLNFIRCLLLPTFRSLAEIVSEPEDLWSCKRSPGILALYKLKTSIKMAEQTLTLISHNPSFTQSFSLLYQSKSRLQDAIFSKESTIVIFSI